MEINLLTLCYLLGSVSFIVGLKMLSHPDTARKGNWVAAAGMAIAILGTIFLYSKDGVKLGNYGWIFGGLAVGTIAGTLAAKKVKMTSMPEMVSLFNGMGGACAALISIIEFQHLTHPLFTDNDLYAAPGSLDGATLLIIFAGLIIGTISFAGSMIAWGKLNGSVHDFSINGLLMDSNIFLFDIIFYLVLYIFLSFFDLFIVSFLRIFIL